MDCGRNAYQMGEVRGDLRDMPRVSEAILRGLSRDRRRGDFTGLNCGSII